MEIVFCDIYKSFIEACDKYIKSNPELQKYFKFTTYFGDIRDLKIGNNTAFLSPANSFLSYGGGIDLIYNQDMFPDIQTVLMKKLDDMPNKQIISLKRSFDSFSKNVKRPILPVGQAIITPLTEYEKYETCYLISAPTMEYPMSIKGTNNPYLAFLATLNIIKDNMDLNIVTLVCPGLGTGIGDVSADDSAKQIFEALNEFVKSL